MKYIVLIFNILIFNTVFAYQNEVFNIIDEMISLRDMELSRSGSCKTIIKLYNHRFSEGQQSLLNATLKKEEIKEYVKKSFSLRLLANQRIKELDRNTTYFNECLDQVKVLTQTLGYVEDYLVATYTKEFDGKKMDEQKFKFPYLNSIEGVNGIKDLDSIQTGDIFLTRARTFGSAAIARIGTKDTLYSHLGMFYRDESGKLFTIESLIEHGLIIAPVEQHLKRKHVKTLVFRSKNRVLGRMAAEQMYAFAMERLNVEKNISYDFAMNYKEHSNYFCSEVVRHAYELASSGDVILPMYKTKVNEGLRPFLNGIGVKLTENEFKDFDLFAPSDIQFDSRFEMIAEWKRPNELMDIRIKDAVLANIYYWMEQDNYVLKPTKASKAIAYLAKTVRGTPLLGLAVKNLYAKTIPVDTVRTFLTLDSVAKKIAKEVYRKEERLGRYLDFNELYKYINKVKERDFKKYQNNERSVFHTIFHPKN